MIGLIPPTTSKILTVLDTILVLKKGNDKEATRIPYGPPTPRANSSYFYLPFKWDVVGLAVRLAMGFKLILR